MTKHFDFGYFFFLTTPEHNLSQSLVYYLTKNSLKNNETERETIVTCEDTQTECFIIFLLSASVTMT